MAATKWNKLSICLPVLSLVLLVGCSSEDPQIAELRQQLSIEAEPSGATTIAVAKEGVGSNPDVSVVAQILSDESEAFVAGQAAFFIEEVGTESHCENPDCPFCKEKNAGGPAAAVQFVGETGEPLAFDARELLQVRSGDTVVIEGKGEVVQGMNLLQITAETIFVRARTEPSN
ncbi:MAG: hypothetical protein MPJ50_16445 [Pirellulales bacterium]|nr:hypothetical protein [Pirellulales bacterium]